VSTNAWQREPKSLSCAESRLTCGNSGRTSILLRWLKFNLVGGIGIVVQLAALILLKSGLHFHYLAATAIAVEVAVLHNFVWHEKFTWKDRVQRSWRRSLARLARFHLANGAVSILGNILLMKILVGMERMNYLAANGIAIVLCSVVNFVLSDAWVFARGRRIAD
jgi:putative flippase GtrA